jgi:5-methylthioadenosine/S-adenosylhomocysteine deaminase
MILSLLLIALAQNAPVDLLITNGTVVTMDREMRVLERASVAIRGDRIDSIIPAGGRVPAARETLDATGQLVIPGLINTHGHAPMVMFRGLADDMRLMEWLNDVIFPAEKKNVDADLSYWGTLLSSIEMLRSGTTTFVDMYYFEDDMARAVDKIGVRAVLGQTIIGFPAPDFKTPEESLAATEAFIKKYKSHPRIIPSPAPHAIYTTALDIVKKARELSVKYGVPFQIHARENAQEDEQVKQKFGKTTIEVLEDAGILGPGVLLHHTVTLSDTDIPRLVRFHVATSHNPESNLKVAAGIAPVPSMLRAGVTVGLGTDGAASNNNLDMFEEMDTAAKIHKVARNDPTVMSAREVFRMATLGGAAAIGMADRLGSLEAGKLADVVLVDLSAPELHPLYDVYSQLVYAIKGAHVRSTIVGGKVVVRDRNVTTVDTSEVLSHTLEIQRRIQKSLGRPVTQ